MGVRGLIEVPGLIDTYISGIGHIEDVGGGNLRFYLFVNQGVDRLVIAKVVMPRDAMPPAFQEMTSFMARSGLRVFGGLH